MKDSIKVILIDSLILIICLLGIINLVQKPALPFSIYSSDNRVKILSDYNHFKKDDVLLKLNDINIKAIEEVEFYLDGMKKGDTVTVSINNYTTQVSLIQFYSTSYLWIISIVSALFFLIGLFVYIESQDRKSAIYFHWSTIATGTIIATTWGSYNYLPLYLGHLTRFLFHMAYTFVPALFYHFAVTFPINREAKSKSLLISFYIIGLLLSLLLNTNYIISIYSGGQVNIDNYLTAFNILRVFIIIGVIESIWEFLRSYNMAKTQPEKKQLKWLLFGFFIGPVPYIVFWVLPQAFELTILPEEAVIILMLAVPATFTISIIRYHILDVDFVINRSIVYAIILGGLFLIYGTVTYILSDIATDNFQKTIYLTLASLFLAILFQPARKVIQGLVDKKFFRVQYNFRNTINSFLKEIKDCPELSKLGEIVMFIINNLFHIDKGVIFLVTDGRISILNSIFSGGPVRHPDSEFLLKLTNPLGLKAKIENGSSIFSVSDKEEIQGMSIIFPLFNSEKKLNGILALGSKKSGQRYAIEDIDLLNAISLEIAYTIERIVLQQEFVITHLQNERLKELDQMKSFFISGTAHELKTPLTSIKLYAELIDDQCNEKEYLKIIESECDRLSRMVDNMLDISKIDRGEKRYQLQETDLKDVIETVNRIMKYQFKIEQCEITYDVQDSETFIFADYDAVTAALINLLSNALKYSTFPKRINVNLYTKENNAVISVTDNGIGIKEEEINIILQPYYRSTFVKNSNFVGTGLGLAIVKHIIDAHNGSIKINSDSNGSTFSLFFPLLKHQVKHE